MLSPCEKEDFHSDVSSTARDYSVIVCIIFVFFRKTGNNNTTACVCGDFCTHVFASIESALLTAGVTARLFGSNLHHYVQQ